DAARSTVRDAEIAVREEHRLRNVLPDLNIRRLRAEDVGIELAADGNDHVCGQLTQSGENALEEVAGLEVEDRPECEVDERTSLARRKPPQVRVVDVTVRERGPNGVRARRQRIRRVAKARWERRQHEVPVEHDELFVR